MQMVVYKEGSFSVKEEQFKSVAEITWKEALTIQILPWQRRTGVVLDNEEKLPLWFLYLFLYLSFSWINFCPK